MSSFLWVGTGLGAVIGLLHALHVITTRWDRPGLNRAKTLWHAFWTWFLWTLCGAYVLAFWLVGLAVLGIARFVGTSERAP